MNNPFNRQSQFELFPGAPSAESKKEETPLFGQPVRLSFENVIIFGIAFIMGMVVSFSFGIEKGKRCRTAPIQQTVVAVKDKPQVAQAAGAEAVATMKAGIILPVEAAGGVLPSEEIVGGAGAVEKQLEINENTADSEKSVDINESLEKIHTIQVASFKQKDRAQREADDLKKIGHDAFIAKKKAYYIVCVGKFEESQEAKTVLKGLKKKYSDCYIRSM